jgi:hypothetical protein
MTQQTMTPDEIAEWERKMREPKPRAKPGPISIRSRRPLRKHLFIARYCRRWHIDGFLPVGVYQALAQRTGVNHDSVIYHCGGDYEIVDARMWGNIVAGKMRADRDR